MKLKKFQLGHRTKYPHLDLKKSKYRTAYLTPKGQRVKTDVSVAKYLDAD
jgi:hypothetical protein